VSAKARWRPAAAALLLLVLPNCRGETSEQAEEAQPAGPRQPAARLKSELLAINRGTAPFVIRDGTREGVDLVAEWRIVDAQWYEIFAKAGLERVFKVLMKFDAQRGEVRTVDQAWDVEWRAGVPTLSLSARAFTGQQWERSFGTAYAFRENGRYGRVYDYRFDTEELKGPLKEAVRRAGWRWRPVSFGAL
jgi:hypothetical protein